MKDLKLSVLINAIDKFSAPAKKIAGVSEKMAACLHDGQKALNDLGRKGQAIKHLKALESRLGKTSDEMSKARNRTAQLGREIAATAKPTKKLQREFETVRRKSDALRKRHREQRDELRKLRGELRGAGLDTRKLGEVQRKIAGDIDVATKKMEHMADITAKLDKARQHYDRRLQRAANVALVAGGLDRLGRGALNMVSAPIDRMRQVERSRGELSSLGIGKNGIDQIAQRGRQMASKLAGITTAAFVSASYDIKSGISSLSDKGVADMTELSALTAKATKANIGQMTSLFATGYGSFKKSLYADVSDQEFGQIFSASLAKSVKQFKTDGDKMQQSIQSMGSGLAESGASLADQFTALGMLQQKMEAGVAGTVMSALERSAGQAQARFQKMGIDIETLDENGNLRKLPELLEDMQKTFGAKYTTQTGTQIQQAFGSGEAVKFFKALWGQQDTFRANAKALEEVQRQGTAFTRTMAKAMDSNMDARLQLMQQRWDVIKEKLGYALIPILEWAVPVLEKVANGISDMVENGGMMPKLIMGFVGAIGIVATVAAPLITAFASLATAMAWAGYMAKKYRASMMADGLSPGGSNGKGRRGGRGKGGNRKGGKGWRGLASKAGGFFKGKAGMLGAGLSTVAIGSTLMDSQMSAGEKAAAMTQDATAIGGAIAGAKVGAMAGAILGPVGAIVGGLAGSLIGGLSGDYLGGKIAGFFDSDNIGNKIAKASEPVKKATGAALVGTTLMASTVMAATPIAAPAATQHTDNSTHSYQLTIQQLPGEDPQALTERIMHEIERRQQQRQREGLHDDL
ncbi:MAG: phage tail tape measure protein [endosymbiont of Seepiophila jonesi]|uniref:Phage tail tape measure protein n=1 Tax=endosymbiont of Lamellibrachia luymesi TaxID=2200907 RepID=A0A370E1B3_9GAMM|nr:MAG: phage tail tape measure protein [endosymbiont of Lamellibrachia luymesi]RDH92079.1 MAG: phage tail tape measure protein [endosymbiont of Seepiophila jonesi]